MSQSKQFRRSFRSRVLPAICRRIAKIGIRLEPFLIVHEGNVRHPPRLSVERFTFRFMQEADFDSLIGFGSSETRDKMLWLDDGKRCFAAWDGSRLAAKMWCDFQSFNFRPQCRPLKDDEVYLFAAYSHPDYRGQGLAPAMRFQCYAALNKLGRSKYYSVTDYFNPAARRFKEKLGAKNELLGLHVSLFSRWSRTFTLRKYI